MRPINIVKIKENVSKSHDEFMKNLGPHSDRVLAEHNLTMELTSTRIKFICDTFLELGIVDKVDIRKDTPARKVYLSKDSYDNYVCISTNGNRIVMDGSSYLTSMRETETDSMLLMDGANTDNFDWVDFSDKLLALVHGIIYERKEAFETKLWGVTSKEG